MRINNQEIKNAEISVVAERKVQGLKGLKAIFTYEARIKKKGRTYKKQSEDLGFLQNWLLLHRFVVAKFNVRDSNLLLKRSWLMFLAGHVNRPGHPNFKSCPARKVR